MPLDSYVHPRKGKKRKKKKKRERRRGGGGQQPLLSADILAATSNGSATRSTLQHLPRVHRSRERKRKTGVKDGVVLPPIPSSPPSRRPQLPVCVAARRSCSKREGTGGGWGTTSSCTGFQLRSACADLGEDMRTLTPVTLRAKILTWPVRKGKKGKRRNPKGGRSTRVALRGPALAHHRG